MHNILIITNTTLIEQHKSEKIFSNCGSAELADLKL